MGKIPQNPYKAWNDRGKPYNFTKKRQGETCRECVTCGREYSPNSRNQKYCPECRAGKERGRHD